MCCVQYCTFWGLHIACMYVYIVLKIDIYTCSHMHTLTHIFIHTSAHTYMQVYTAFLLQSSPLPPNTQTQNDASYHTGLAFAPCGGLELVSS